MCFVCGYRRWFLCFEACEISSGGKAIGRLVVIEFGSWHRAKIGRAECRCERRGGRIGLKDVARRRRKKPESKVVRRVAKRVVIKSGGPSRGEELEGERMRPWMKISRAGRTFARAAKVKLRPRMPARVASYNGGDTSAHEAKRLPKSLGLMCGEVKWCRADSGRASVPH
jgi:hypothetical protein